MVWDLAGWLPSREIWARFRKWHWPGTIPSSAAYLLWEARKCNSIDIGLLAFASGPENSFDHI